MYKRAILISSLLALPIKATAAGSPLAAGVFIGSPSSGVTVKYREELQFSMGLDTLSLTADAIWKVSDLSRGTFYSPFYTFTGIQWVDDDKHEWGPRAGAGLLVPYDYFHLYAEGGMTWYVQSDSSLELEGTVGIRFDL